MDSLGIIKQNNFKVEKQGSDFSVSVSGFSAIIFCLLIGIAICIYVEKKGGHISRTIKRIRKKK